MKKLSVLFLAMLFLAACGSKSSEADYYANTEAKENLSVDAPPPPPADQVTTDGLTAGNSTGTYNVSMSVAQGSTSTISTEESFKDEVTKGTGDNSPGRVERIKIPEKIKKTADINITVEDYKKAHAAIEKLVKSGSAYISSENEQNSTYSLSNTMVIRVVNKHFDAMVNNVTGVASHVNSKNIYTEDVTSQFVDIIARLKTKKEVEKRYFEILKKANKITDILEVEEKIRVIQEEIEAKEGQLKYLNDQVDYSTINLSFHQDYEYTPKDEPGFFGRLGHAFGNGWKGFLGFIVGIVYAWPLWIILGIGAYFLVRFIKKQLKK